MGAKKFSPMEIDAIGEIMNISLGSSATAASTMLDAKVDITTPKVKIQSRDEFNYSNLEPAICVEITYVEGLTGSNVMLLKRHDVKVIVEKLMGMEIPDEEFELNELNVSAICEVMNQMMGASATALSELLGRTVNISTPRSFEVSDDEAFKDKYFPKNVSEMVVVSFFLDIAGKLDSEFMNLMPVGLAKELVKGFFPDLVDDEDEDEEGPAAEPMPAEEAPALGGSNEKMSQEEMDALFASMGAGEAPSEEEAPAPGGSNKKMSQEEMDALFASMGAGEAPSEEEASAPGGSNEKMSQEAMDALFASMSAEAPAAQAQPAPAPTVQAQPAPAPTVQPAPAVAPQVQAAPSADLSVFAQSMLEMQKLQMKMLEQMQQMEKDRQAAASVQALNLEGRGPRQLKVRGGIQKSVHDAEAEIDPDGNLDLIMGVPVEVSVEIGRTRKLVKDVLELNKGSLVVLDKLAGEQVDLYVNGQCIAKGDVVVVDDNFGFRITQILTENLPGIV